LTSAPMWFRSLARKQASKRTLSKAVTRRATRPRSQQTKDALGRDDLDVVAHRGYFNSAEILVCEEAGITVTLPKPITSNAKADGRFGKQDFHYLSEGDVYIFHAGEKLAYHYTNEENGLAQGGR
jgi:hypothetical protein